MRLFLVHGSVANGLATWAAQRPLEQRFELVVWNRPGYPPGEPVERIDFEQQARELERAARAGRPPLRALLRRRDRAARGGALRPELGSLTVVEPPAFAVARGRPGRRARWSRGSTRFFDAGPHDAGRVPARASCRSSAAHLRGCPTGCRRSSSRARARRWSSGRRRRPRSRSTSWRAAVPEARRLGRARARRSSAVCDVLEDELARRARGAARRRPLGAAARRAVQPRARGLRGAASAS